MTDAEDFSWEEATPVVVEREPEPEPTPEPSPAPKRNLPVARARKSDPKELPASLEAEEYLLSCCFIDGEETVAKCKEHGITPHSFFSPANALIFGTMLAIHGRNLPVDAAIVAEELKAAGKLDQIGGFAYLTQVSGRVPTTAQAPYFIDRVRDLRRQRQLSIAVKKTLESLVSPDAKSDDIIEDLRVSLAHISETGLGLGSGITAASLCDKPPPVPPELISGVLYGCGTMMLSGPSKSRKTYTFADLGISVAAGSNWLGFATTKANVLYLNFELSEHSFARRISAICRAKGIAPPVNFRSLNLRGRTATMCMLSAELPRLIRMHNIGLVILDPWYKISAQSGAEENSNDGQARILAEAERIVTANGAALVVGHHFSKGEAAAKNAIDRAAGAGAMARWGDCIATMSEHEETDAMTLDLFLRDFAPVGPFALRWQLPLWHRDASLDPAKLKRAGRIDQHPATALLEKLPPQGMTNAEWKKASGWTPSTYDRKRDELERAGKVERVMNVWKPC